MRTLTDVTKLPPTSELSRIRGTHEKKNIGYYLSSGLWSGVILRGNIREMPLLKGVPLGDGPCTGIKLKESLSGSKNHLLT
jgi:hypothetical protein